jgi:putative peptidoglycan lipid II flippase
VALVTFCAQLYLMKRKIGGIEGRKILASLVKVVIASIALSIASYFTYIWLFSTLGDRGLLLKIVETFVPMAAGILAFLLFARLLKMKELDQALGMVKRRFRRG